MTLELIKDVPKFKKYGAVKGAQFPEARQVGTSAVFPLYPGREIRVIRGYWKDSNDDTDSVAQAEPSN